MATLSICLPVYCVFAYGTTIYNADTTAVFVGINKTETYFVGWDVSYNSVPGAYQIQSSANMKVVNFSKFGGLLAIKNALENASCRSDANGRKDQLGSPAFVMYGYHDGKVDFTIIGSKYDMLILRYKTTPLLCRLGKDFVDAINIPLPSTAGDVPPFLQK